MKQCAKTRYWNKMANQDTQRYPNYILQQYRYFKNHMKTSYWNDMLKYDAETNYPNNMLKQQATDMFGLRHYEA